MNIFFCFRYIGNQTQNEYHSNNNNNNNNNTMNTMNTMNNNEDRMDVSDVDSNDCAICLSTLGERNVCLTECGHAFCLSCLLQAARRKPDCPLCRHALLPVPVNEDVIPETPSLFAHWNSDLNHDVHLPVTEVIHNDNNNNNNMFRFSFDELLANMDEPREIEGPRWSVDDLYGWMDMDRMPGLESLSEAMAENVLSENVVPDWMNQTPVQMA